MLSKHWYVMYVLPFADDELLVILSSVSTSLAFARLQVMTPVPVPMMACDSPRRGYLTHFTALLYSYIVLSREYLYIIVAFRFVREKREHGEDTSCSV